MPVSPGYRAFVLEQLEPIAPITWKSMFGGVGLYANEFFFALIAEDRLYFKVDDSNRPDFEAAGMGPFRPYDDERAMQYYEVPIDVLEDPDLLRIWVEKAVEVARAARRRKRRR
jgi:DNA transformation protein